MICFTLKNIANCTTCLILIQTSIILREIKNATEGKNKNPIFISFKVHHIVKP